MRKILFIAFSCCLLGCTKTSTIVIYHTGDIGGWFWSRTSSAGDFAGKRIGGFAALKKLVDSEKHPHLLLDAGNWLYGTPENIVLEGKAVVECMNKTGYDAAGVGHGEFALGYKALKRLTGQARFPVLGANIYHAGRNSRPSFLKPYVIKEIGGFKVGIFGLTAQKTSKPYLSTNMAGLRFASEANEAGEMVRKLKEKGAGIIIALVPENIPAKEIPGVDIIIGKALIDGREHPDSPIRVGKTWIIPTPGSPASANLFGMGSPSSQTEGSRPALKSSGSRSPSSQTEGRLTHAGRIEMRVNSLSGRLYKLRSSSVLLDNAVLGQDLEILKLARFYRKKTATKLDRKIGQAPLALKRAQNQERESEIGNWVADCVRKWRKTDAALIDSVSIQSDINSGPVTMRTLYELVPFDSIVMRVKLRGNDLLRVLEDSVSKENGNLQISGIKVVFDPDRAGRKIRSVFVGGKPISKNRIYRLAVPDFMLVGREGAGGALSNLVEFISTRRSIRGILKSCIRRRKVLRSPGLGRWVETDKSGS